MLEFDAYVPETWVDRGIIVAVELKEIQPEMAASPLQKAKARFAPLIGSIVVAVGVALTNLPFVAEGAVANFVQVAEPTVAQYAADDVTSTHWNRLVALLQQTPALPADDTSGDPAPLG